MENEQQPIEEVPPVEMPVEVPPPKRTAEQRREEEDELIALGIL